MSNLGTNNNAAGSSRFVKQKESDAYNTQAATQRTQSRLQAKNSNLSPAGATQRTQSRLLAKNSNSSQAAYRHYDSQWERNNNRGIQTGTRRSYEQLRNCNFEIMPDSNENAARKDKKGNFVPEPPPTTPPCVDDGKSDTKLSSFENLRYANHQPQERTVGFQYKPKLESVLVRKKKKGPPNIFQEVKTVSKWKAATRKSATTTTQKPEAIFIPPSTKKKANVPRPQPLFPKATLAKGHENDWTKITSNDSETYKFKQSGCGLKQQVWENFDYEAMGPSTLTAWISPGEKPVTPPPLEVLRRQHPIPDHENEKLLRQGVREENALNYYEKSQMERLQVENYVLDKVNRPRGQMMLRRNQCQPKCETGGLEKDIWLEERAQTPVKFPDWAFFTLPIELRHHEGLACQITKKQRGYDMILDPAGKPTVTDEELRSLEMMEGPPEEPDDSSVGFSESEVPSEGYFNDNCPLMQHLGVVGCEYRRAQNEIKGEYQDFEKDGKPMGMTLKSEASAQSARSKKSLHTRSTIKSLKSIKGLAVNDIEDFNDYDMSYVGLKFGDALLSWSEDTDRASRKWIIEVGCSAEVGEKSLSHVFLENTGTSVISYSWVKVARNDPLQTNRYHRDRFIFDDWGGNILPGEIYRAPILYKSTETGYFSQDWRLMTQPVLECGAVVILRMWGVSRQYDPYFLAKDKVDEAIRARIPWNIVSHRVEKIFDYLPLREDSYKDIRFPLITLGSELFLFHNPFLYYHSAAVYRLGKLFDIMQLRKSKSRTMTKDFSRSGSESGESSPEVNEPEEEEEDYEEEDILSLPSEDDSSQIGLFDTLVDFSKVQMLDTKAIIQYAADAIRDMIDPDKPHLKDVEAIYNAQYVDDDGNGVEDSPRKGLPVAPINLVNPDFMIEKLRTDILTDHGITEIKEALFDVYSKEVDFLFFQPNIAREDWKTVVGRSLLSQCLDKFSDFASGLQDICFEAEYRQHELVRNEELERNRSLDDASSIISSEGTNEKNSGGSFGDAKSPKSPSNKKPPLSRDEKKGASDKSRNASSHGARQPRQSSPNKSANAAGSTGGNLGANPSNPQMAQMHAGGRKSVAPTGSQRASRPDSTELLPESLLPAGLLLNLKDSISPARYKDQYYTRLHMRMYQLLCEVFDNMDKLFSTEKQPAIRLDYKEVAFKKIRNVQMPVNIDSLLEAPLPPKWVAMAEKLKDAKDRRRRRATELDCPWLPGAKGLSGRNRSNSNEVQHLQRTSNIARYESKLEFTTNKRAYNQSNSNSETVGVTFENTSATKVDDRSYSYTRTAGIKLANTKDTRAESFTGPWTAEIRLKNKQNNAKRADAGKVENISETKADVRINSTPGTAEIQIENTSDTRMDGKCNSNSGTVGIRMENINDSKADDRINSISRTGALLLENTKSDDHSISYSGTATSTGFQWKDEPSD